MKILLLGELSGFHNHLKSGLIKLGHEVKIAGTGDGWKRFPVDIDFSVKNEKFYNKIYRNLKPLLNIRELENFDVIQFATPLLFNPYLNFLYYYILSKINNNNSHLCGISTNDPYYLLATKHMHYSPFQDFNENERKRYFPTFSRHDIESHKNIISMVKSVIPSIFDYRIGYKMMKYPKLCATIPFPYSDLNKSYSENLVKNKLKLFHGITRGLNKGSSYITEAMEIAKKKYKNDIELIIVKKVPYNRYKELVDQANIIFDQCLSYTYAYNAIIGLSKGKIVMSGAEKVAIDDLNIKGVCPVINIKPDKYQILAEIEQIIENKSKIADISKMGVDYVKNNHQDTLVAKKYLNTWFNK